MRPDFGEHLEDFESGGYKTTLACKYIVPGLTFQDLSRIFHDAKAKAEPGDEYAGNPARWPDERGIYAVVEAMLDAIYPPSPL